MHDSLVLIVEDDPAIRTLVARQLKLAGFNSEPVNNAEEALERITRGDISMVVLDIHLQGNGEGIDLLSRVRGLDPELPVVFLTGYPDAAEDYPDVPLVQKPYQARELVAKVKHELRTRCRDRRIEDTHAAVQSVHDMLKTHIEECAVSHKRTLGDLLRQEGANPIVWFLLTALTGVLSLAVGAWKANNGK